MASDWSAPEAVRADRPLLGIGKQPARIIGASGAFEIRRKNLYSLRVRTNGNYRMDPICDAIHEAY
jgi:hypothetical protein